MSRSGHVATAWSLALCVAAADVAIGRAAPWIDRAPMTDVVQAWAWLGAMLMPVGVLVGTLLSLLSWLLRPLPWFAHVRTALVQPSQWLAHDPDAFAWLLSVVTTLPLAYLLAFRAALHFATHYHNAELASLALAAVMLALFSAVIVVVSVLRPLLRWWGTRLGRVASIGTVMLLVMVGMGTLALGVWQSRRDLVAVLDGRTLLLVVGALALYPLLLVGVRRLLHARWRSIALHVVLSAATLGGLGASAFAYTQSHRVRAIVERETSFGVRLRQAYMRASDRDGDGYAAWFGGGDCNDADRHVHPGAMEMAGDGVDSNCMGGDTDRDVSDLSDGVYAAVPAALGRPNLLLITIDALRPDRLGAYNAKQRKVSPHIDAFAKTAARFTQVISPSSRSIRSIPAMLIGAYPSQIAFGPELLWPALLSDNETAIEALSQHGYQTAAVIGTNYFSHLPDFFQGFGIVQQARTYKPVRKEAASRAIEVLDTLHAKRRPWMTWVHLFNVHEPYLHDQTKSRFGGGRTGAYDTEVSLADEQVGRLLEWLHKRGDPAHTVVVIASDHGEAFMEHGTIGHSYTLYNEELLSTLLVRVPGVAPRVVDEPVSLIDIAPTLLNMGGVPMPRQTPARSLLPLVTNTAVPNAESRALYAELMPDGSLPSDEKALILDGWKLLWWQREDTLQLFNLRADPGERNDLVDTERGRAQQLHERLRAWVAQTHLRQHRRDEVLARHRLKTIPDAITRADVDYGPFTLVGYAVNQRTLRPGDKLNLDLYFESRNLTRDDYFFEIAFEGPNGYAMPRYLNAAHYPLNGSYRTYEWRSGERLRDPIQITIPKGTDPARLEMRMRIVRRGSQRVVLNAPNTKDGWISLGQVQIKK